MSNKLIALIALSISLGAYNFTAKAHASDESIQLPLQKNKSPKRAFEFTEQKSTFQKVFSTIKNNKVALFVVLLAGFVVCQDVAAKHFIVDKKEADYAERIKNFQIKMPWSTEPFNFNSSAKKLFGMVATVFIADEIKDALKTAKAKIVSWLTGPEEEKASTH